MGRASSGNLLVGVAIAGAGVTGLGLMLAATLTKRNQAAPRQKEPEFTSQRDADIEALARMFASENPRGGERLLIELAWTQLRSLGKGQTLFGLLTAGSGFGEQGEKENDGGVRPVSTAEPATPRFRQLAERILAGLEESTLAGARRFFEPLQQDKAYAVGTRARAKLARGEPLTTQERRLRNYKSDAEQLRKRWTAKGHRKIGTIEGVEFYT